MKRRFVRVVPKQVAGNPVAQAVARANLRSASLDFGIRLHTMQPDEACRAEAETLVHVIQLMILVLDQRGQVDSPDCRVMLGAMGALDEIRARGWRWKPAALVAVDQGLQRAIDVFDTATPTEMHRAHVALARVAAAA